MRIGYVISASLYALGLILILRIRSQVNSRLNQENQRRRIRGDDNILKLHREFFPASPLTLACRTSFVAATLCFVIAAVLRLTL